MLGGVPTEFPPPQATQSMAKPPATPMVIQKRRCLVPKNVARIAAARKSRIRSHLIPVGVPGGRTLGPRINIERPMVVIVTVAIEAVEPFIATEAGEMEQFEAGGCPAHVSSTGWLKPFNGVILKVTFVDCPAGILAELEETDIEKSAPDAGKAILDRKASAEETQLPQAGWKGLVVGKSKERVNPVT